MIRAAALTVAASLWAAAGSCTPVPPPTTDPSPTTVLFQDRFDRPDGLLTNEYATWNPANGDSVSSADWVQNSGSLFVRSGAAWSGVPDGGSPDATSTTATGSAVLRVTTRRQDLASVRVRLLLRVDRLVTTSRTPATDWDGVHVLLRYRSEEQLYYASVDRRDGSLAIKKKCPGGTTNGGTYTTLAATPPGSHPIPYGTWHQAAVGVVDNADGSVTIRIFRDGQRVLQAVDRGAGCAPIRGGGAVGIRGDNAQFAFDDFSVRPE
jgi:hypothetical protein